MPRRPGNIKDSDVYRELQTIYNILDILSPINPKAKNASIIQTNEGITTAQNISVEGAPNWEQIGAGVEPKSGLSLTIKSKTDIGTDTRAQNWRTSTGWGIAHEDGEYTQYIDNLVIKGWLKAKEFIIEQTRIRDANYLFTNGGIVEKTDGVSWFDVEDPNENHTASFEQYDIIECLQVNLTGASFTGGEIDDDDFLIKRLVFQVTSVDGVRVNVTTTAGAPANKGTIKKGDVFARVANTTTTSRQGLVGIFNDEENAPYFDIRGSLNSYAAYKSNSNLKVRLGKLDGITDAAFGDLSGSQTDLYGAYLAGNIYIKGSIQIANPGDIDTSDLNNDAGWTANSITVSASAPSSPTTYQMWYDSSTGDNILKYWDGDSWEVMGSNGTYMDGTGLYTGTVAANKIIAGTGIINNLSVLSTLTMGSSGTDGYIQSYGWNGTANGYQLKGGATPSINVIGGTITGGTIQTSTSTVKVLLTSDKIGFYSGGGEAYRMFSSTTGGGDYPSGTTQFTMQSGFFGGTTILTNSIISPSYDSNWTLYDNLTISNDLQVSGDLSVTGSYGLADSDMPYSYLRLGTGATATQTVGGTSFAYGVLFQRSDAANAPATFDQRGAGLLADIRQGGTTKVSISNSGVLKAVGYQSSDSTSGATASVDPTGVSTLEFKNGLFVGTT